MFRTKVETLQESLFQSHSVCHEISVFVLFRQSSKEMETKAFAFVSRKRNRRRQRHNKYHIVTNEDDNQRTSKLTRTDARARADTRHASTLFRPQKHNVSDRSNWSRVQNCVVSCTGQRTRINNKKQYPRVCTATYRPSEQGKRSLLYSDATS